MKSFEYTVKVGNSRKTGGNVGKRGKEIRK